MENLDANSNDVKEQKLVYIWNASLDKLNNFEED